MLVRQNVSAATLTLKDRQSDNWSVWSKTSRAFRLNRWMCIRVKEIRSAFIGSFSTVCFEHNAVKKNELPLLFLCFSLPICVCGWERFIYSPSFALSSACGACHGAVELPRPTVLPAYGSVSSWNLAIPSWCRPAPAEARCQTGKPPARQERRTETSPRNIERVICPVKGHMCVLLCTNITSKHLSWGQWTGWRKGDYEMHFKTKRWGFIDNPEASSWTVYFYLHVI